MKNHQFNTHGIRVTISARMKTIIINNQKKEKRNYYKLTTTNKVTILH